MLDINIYNGFAVI